MEWGASNPSRCLAKDSRPQCQQQPLVAKVANTTVTAARDPRRPWAPWLASNTETMPSLRSSPASGTPSQGWGWRKKWKAKAEELAAKDKMPLKGKTMIQAMTVWDHSGPSDGWRQTQWTKEVLGVNSKTTALEKQKQHCEFLEENRLIGATQDRGLVSSLAFRNFG